MDTRTAREREHLLRVAQRHHEAAWLEARDKRDMMGNVDMATHWGAVITAYAGLEQALKALASYCVGKPLEELTAPRRGDKPKGPLNTHDLMECWKRIDQEARARISEHWRQFASLYPDLQEGEYEKHYGSAEAYLRYLSAPKGAAYMRWRYALVEDEPLPKISVEGMILLWRSAADIFGDRSNPKRRERADAPFQRIGRAVARAWECAFFAVSVQDDPGGYKLEDHKRRHREWIREHGGHVNAAEKVLWRVSRGLAAHGPEETPEMTATLREMGERIEKLVATEKDASVRQWGIHARYQGISIRKRNGMLHCDTKTRLAKSELVEGLPEGSVQIPGSSYTLELPEEIQNELYAGGYDVTEYDMECPSREARGRGRFLAVCKGTRGEGDASTTIELWKEAWEVPGDLAVRITGDCGHHTAQMVVRLLRVELDQELGTWEKG